MFWRNGVPKGGTNRIPMNTSWSSTLISIFVDDKEGPYSNMHILCISDAFLKVRFEYVGAGKED